MCSHAVLESNGGHLGIVRHLGIVKLKVDVLEIGLEAINQFLQFVLHAAVGQLHVSLVPDHVLDVVLAVFVIVDVVLEPLVLLLLLIQSYLSFLVPVEGNTLHGSESNGNNGELHFISNY